MSPYVQWVVTIFMILFGVNFNAYFLLLMRRFRRAAASEEVRAYFVIIGVAVVIIRPTFTACTTLGRGPAPRRLPGGLYHHHHRFFQLRF